MDKKRILITSAVLGAAATTTVLMLNREAVVVPDEPAPAAELINREGIGFSLSWDKGERPYKILLKWIPDGNIETAPWPMIKRTTIYAPLENYTWIGLENNIIYEAVVTDREGTEIKVERFRSDDEVNAYKVKANSSQAVWVSDDLNTWYVIDAGLGCYSVDPSVINKCFFRVEDVYSNQ